VESLQHQTTDRPALTAILDALDEVLNSNTLLLKAHVGRPLTTETRPAALRELLDDQLFLELLYEADSARKWWNLAEWDDELEDYVPAPQLAEIRRPGVELTVSPLTEPTFRQHLCRLLTETPSPYNMHCTPERAEQLAEAFCAELADDAPTVATPTAFAAVRPDFLHISGYYAHNNQPTGDPYYFDGGTSDTCTAIHHEGGQILWLLLTNGCP
jgi:hypothetical protein